MPTKFKFNKSKIAQAARDELKGKSVKVGDSKKRPGKIVKSPKPLGAGKELTLAFAQVRGEGVSKSGKGKASSVITGSASLRPVKPVEDNANVIATRKIAEGEFDAWIANDASSDLYLVLIGDKFRVVSYNVKAVAATVIDGEYLNSNAGFRNALQELAKLIK